MPSGVDENAVREIDGTFFTLIPSRFPPVSLFERIAAPAGQDAVAEVESITNPRLRDRRRVLAVDVVDVDSPVLQNWNHAPFAYRNPEGSRFFGPERPVLELADDLQTALAVSVRRREAFLARTAERRTGLDMRVLARSVKGRFADLRHVPAGATAEARRKIGGSIAGVDGVLYRPPERPDAECVAVVDPRCLGRAVQGEHFRYVWDGERVRSLYSFSGDGRAILAEELAAGASVLAA